MLFVVVFGVVLIWNIICFVWYGCLLGLVMLLVFVRLLVVMFRCWDWVVNVDLVILKIFSSVIC